MTSTNNKQVKLHIHPNIKKTLQQTNTNQWIQTQIKQYQPQLKLPPIPNYKKTIYRPRLNQETLQQLTTIPGNTPSQKITRLYFNQIEREYHTKLRKKILHQLFPNNTFS